MCTTAYTIGPRLQLSALTTSLAAAFVCASCSGQLIGKYILKCKTSRRGELNNEGKKTLRMVHTAAFKCVCIGRVVVVLYRQPSNDCN